MNGTTSLSPIPHHSSCKRPLLAPSSSPPTALQPARPGARRANPTSLLLPPLSDDPPYPRPLQQSFPRTSNQQGWQQRVLQGSVPPALSSSSAAHASIDKGTGSFPGLGPKRTGRHGYGKAPYLLMPERMRTFVVPEGLNDCEVDKLPSSHLVLLTFRAHSSDRTSLDRSRWARKRLRRRKPSWRCGERIRGTLVLRGRACMARTGSMRRTTFNWQVTSRRGRRGWRRSKREGVAGV